jgi:hypothetical protein
MSPTSLAQNREVAHSSSSPCRRRDPAAVRRRLGHHDARALVRSDRDADVVAGVRSA